MFVVLSFVFINPKWWGQARPTGFSVKNLAKWMIDQMPDLTICILLWHVVLLTVILKITFNTEWRKAFIKDFAVCTTLTVERNIFLGNETICQACTYAITCCRAWSIPWVWLVGSWGVQEGCSMLQQYRAGCSGLSAESAPCTKVLC